MAAISSSVQKGKSLDSFPDSLAIWRNASQARRQTTQVQDIMKVSFTASEVAAALFMGARAVAAVQTGDLSALQAPVQLCLSLIVAQDVIQGFSSTPTTASASPARTRRTVVFQSSPPRTTTSSAATPQPPATASALPARSRRDTGFNPRQNTAPRFPHPS